MEHNDVKTLIEENYYIEAKYVEKVKNTYKIKDDKEEYCLKVIKYQYPHFNFILSAMLHLQNNGFQYIPNIINTKENKKFICFNSKYCYLTPWLKCRECNYDNPIDLENAAKKLGELHKLSEGFNVTKEMKPRVGWFNLESTFKTRGDEILDFKKRIYQKAYRSDFDRLYLSVMDEELSRAESAIDNLRKNDYIGMMGKEVLKGGFCHHDYAHHNILLDVKDNMHIIDFDYCILDTHLHDLSSLSIRAMKDGKWDIERFIGILEAYDKTNNVREDELGIIFSFIEFPQAYWQLGIQYYWEMQPWEEEMFLKRLIKYIGDRKLREEFLKEVQKKKIL